MFAPKIPNPQTIKSQAIAATVKAERLMPQHSPPVEHSDHDGDRQHDADLLTKPATAGVSWNFITIPRYSPQRPPRAPLHPLACPIQRKLKIGAINGPHEHEADQIAERVVRTEPGANAQVNSVPLQVSRRDGVEQGTGDAPDLVHDVLRSPGQSLDTTTRSFMETRFGRGLGSVRIHTDGPAASSADAVAARAYTVGEHIVFGAGEYLPAASEGRTLLAHEIAHVVQQSGGAPILRRTPKSTVKPAMTEAEAEAWYREMNLEDVFTDPSPWKEGDIPLSNEALIHSIEEAAGQSLSAEEIQRQLLLRRAQPLSASAYQAADPAAASSGLQQNIKRLQAKIRIRKAKIEKLKKQGSSATGELSDAKAEMGALEDEVSALKNARKNLPKSVKFSQIGKGAPAGTGQITYAGIQVETASGRRIALEFAETNATEHAEEAIIRQIESKLSPEQLRGSRVTVVGDQVVCGERCVPALSQFAERNGVESVDGIVFRRRMLTPPPANFVGPQDLASPRTTLRTMTESKSAGTELIRRELSIYRARPTAYAPVDAAAAESVAAHAAAPAAANSTKATAPAAAHAGAPGAAGATATTAVEKDIILTAETAAAKDASGVWRSLRAGFIAELKSMTPAKVAKLGKNAVKEGIKGYVTAKLVDYIIGESELENDLASIDKANNSYHNDLPEKVRAYEKEALGFLPPAVALPLASILSVDFADFLYKAANQDNQRKLNDFRKAQGYAEGEDMTQDDYLLFQAGEKAADDFYNGAFP
jgi:hypothetical protein